MDDRDKLRVLLPHWIEHNGEHAAEFRKWAERAEPAVREAILAAAGLMDEVNARLREAQEGANQRGSEEASQRGGEEANQRIGEEASQRGGELA